MDTGRRTLTKAVLWNLTGMAMMALTGLIVTGSLAVGGGLALLNTGLGFFSYILYERIWARVRWGRV